MGPSLDPMKIFKRLIKPFTSKSVLSSKKQKSTAVPADKPRLAPKKLLKHRMRAVDADEDVQAGFRALEGDKDNATVSKPTIRAVRIIRVPSPVNLSDAGKSHGSSLTIYEASLLEENSSQTIDIQDDALSALDDIHASPADISVSVGNFSLCSHCAPGILGAVNTRHNVMVLVSEPSHSTYVAGVMVRAPTAAPPSTSSSASSSVFLMDTDRQDDIMAASTIQTDSPYSGREYAELFNRSKDFHIDIDQTQAECDTPQPLLFSPSEGRKDTLSSVACTLGYGEDNHDADNLSIRSSLHLNETRSSTLDSTDTAIVLSRSVDPVHLDGFHLASMIDTLSRAEEHTSIEDDRISEVTDLGIYIDKVSDANGSLEYVDNDGGQDTDDHTDSISDPFWSVYNPLTKPLPDIPTAPPGIPFPLYKRSPKSDIAGAPSGGTVPSSASGPGLKLIPYDRPFQKPRGPRHTSPAPSESLYASSEDRSSYYQGSPSCSPSPGCGRTRYRDYSPTGSPSYSRSPTPERGRTRYREYPPRYHQARSPTPSRSPPSKRKSARNPPYTPSSNNPPPFLEIEDHILTFKVNMPTIIEINPDTTIEQFHEDMNQEFGFTFDQRLSMDDIIQLMAQLSIQHFPIAPEPPHSVEELLMIMAAQGDVKMSDVRRGAAIARAVYQPVEDWYEPVEYRFESVEG